MVLSPGIHNPSSWLRNLALLSRVGDALSGTIGERLDSARRLVASGTQEIAAIDEKEVSPPRPGVTLESTRQESDNISHLFSRLLTRGDS